MSTVVKTDNILINNEKSSLFLLLNIIANYTFPLNTALNQ